MLNQQRTIKNIMKGNSKVVKTETEGRLNVVRESEREAVKSEKTKRKLDSHLTTG